jgi:Xaa-Pro aminopeptidase
MEVWGKQGGIRIIFSTCDLSQTPVAEVLHASKARSLKTEEEIVAIRYGIKVVEERLDEMLEREKYGVGQTM